MWQSLLRMPGPRLARHSFERKLGFSIPIHHITLHHDSAGGGGGGCRPVDLECQWQPLLHLRLLSFLERVETMVEDSFQQGRVSKPWVSFRLAEKPWLRTQAGGISLALGLVESLKKHLTANNVNVEGPFKNSLGYVVITCKLPQSIDLLIFPGIKSDPNRWHIRVISWTPFLRRVFSKWRKTQVMSNTKHGKLYAHLSNGPLKRTGRLRS